MQINLQNLIEEYLVVVKNSFICKMNITAFNTGKRGNGGCNGYSGLDN